MKSWEGPGWLFAVKTMAGKKPVFLVAFVGKDGSVDVRRSKAAPAGLSPVDRTLSATVETRPVASEQGREIPRSGSTDGHMLLPILQTAVAHSRNDVHP